MRISARVGDHVGTTAFFRNRPLLDAVFAALERRGQRKLRVLFHACSVGAEAYSFLIHNHVTRGPSQRFRIEAHATDIEPSFVTFAKAATFPADTVQDLTAAERGCFEAAPGGALRVKADIRAQIRFLQPASFAAFTPPGRYDLVFLTNALVYVDAATQGRTLDAVAGYNTGMLVTTAFHMDRIADDLGRNGYAPVTDGIADIHNAWTDRIGMTMPGDVLPPFLHTSPFLAPFQPVPGHEFKHCAIFEKRAA